MLFRAPMLLLLCAALLGTCTAVPVSVNIHVKLNADAEQQAIAYDAWCHARLPSDDVWLATINQPHVTLYLTEFDDSNLTALQTRLNTLAPVFRQCPLPLNATAPSGDYGMWSVLNNDCLQVMSDTVVNATCDLIIPDQPVPAWVYKLPEPQRSEKIKMIQLYGSPNVFSQFEPHVTLAYDNATADNFDVTFAALPSQPLLDAHAVVLGMGRVGNWGTVLRGKDYADWTLPPAAKHSVMPHRPRNHPRAGAHAAAGPRGYGQHAKGRRIPVRGAGLQDEEVVVATVTARTAARTRRG